MLGVRKLAILQIATSTITACFTVQHPPQLWQQLHAVISFLQMLLRFPPLPSLLHRTLFGGRILSGVGVGILSVVVPLYNAEIAPKRLRGRLVSLNQLAITAGIMVSDIGGNLAK